MSLRTAAAEQSCRCRTIEHRPLDLYLRRTFLYQPQPIGALKRGLQPFWHFGGLALQLLWCLLNGLSTATPGHEHVQLRGDDLNISLRDPRGTSSPKKLLVRTTTGILQRYLFLDRRIRCAGYADAWPRLARGWRAFDVPDCGTAFLATWTLAINQVARYFRRDSAAALVGAGRKLRGREGHDEA